ncbi:ANM_collapsed_G0016360.mRNA.1.CDS.1 [Saccharomyces cerevisiae]|nr:ANM_collapsed_G0016360.mRNA.1.CDS.1 [Saccharomyces cerevisiae]
MDVLRRSGKKIKYGHELIIPEESMSSITLKNNTSGIDDRRYKLTGVIYHHGVSSDGGHYTADVYHSEHNKWYRIDDVNITELEDDDVLKGGEEASDSRTAYILMYEKRN